jgi:hypothetical protein
MSQQGGQQVAAAKADERSLGGSHLKLQVIGQAHDQGQDGQGGIGDARGREHRTAGDVEIADPCTFGRQGSTTPFFGSAFIRVVPMWWREALETFR